MHILPASAVARNINILHYVCSLIHSCMETFSGAKKSRDMGFLII